MNTDRMIRELRRLAKKHENDKVFTGQNNWSQMCTDVANRLEEIDNENRQLKDKIRELELKNGNCIDDGK